MYPRDADKEKGKITSLGSECRIFRHSVQFHEYTAKKPGEFTIFCQTMSYTTYFYLSEWSEKIIDIREQYPLSDVETVMRIAASAGIKYPADRVSGFPYVS